MKPHYSMTSPNQPIELYEGDIRLTQLDKYVVQGKGKIFLNWLPFPQIKFALFTDDVNPPMDYNEVKMSLPEFNSDIQGYITELPKDFPQSDNDTWIGGYVLEPIEIGKEKPLSRARFHLVNFNSRGGCQLTSGQWNISIGPVKEFDHLMEHFQVAGGYAITHSVIIERLDKTSFTTQEADMLMEALFYFFSFAKGQWVSIVLPIGFNEEHEVVWKFWYPYKSDSWKNTNSWFIEIAPSILSQVYPGFEQKWQDDRWREALKLIIDLYVESNTQNSETSLLLSQTAFELLSWLILVEEKHILSREGFDRLTAADKIRLLLTHAKISFDLDSRLAKLTDLAKERNWQDGPHALTELRNRMVHPKLRRTQGKNNTPANILGYPVSVRAEACQLGLWYLEGILLWLFGYDKGIVNDERLLRKYISVETIHNN